MNNIVKIYKFCRVRNKTLIINQPTTYLTSYKQQEQQIKSFSTKYKVVNNKNGEPVEIFDKNKDETQKLNLKVKDNYNFNDDFDHRLKEKEKYEEEEEENDDNDEEEEDNIGKRLSSDKGTKVMQQYSGFKKKYPNEILFFRLGDFYEMFDDDAKIASNLLGITLTSRKQGKNRNREIPMCGVPSHSAEIHIAKLVKHGKSVVICDQVEDSNEAKEGRRIINRQIVRIITPGTLYEDRYLTSNSNYLCSILPNGFEPGDSNNKATTISINTIKLSASSQFSISWLDISTGDFFISSCTLDNLSSELNRIQPKEILLPSSLNGNQQISRILKPYNTSIENDLSSFNYQKKTFKFFNIAFNNNNNNNNNDNNNDEDVDINFNNEYFENEFTNDELNSAGSILSYIIKTNIGIGNNGDKNPLLSLNPPKRIDSHNSMFIDYSTMQSLEITKTYQGDKRGSLLECIDKTITPQGGRLLFSRIQSPSLELNEINSRLNLLDFFYNNMEITNEVRNFLNAGSDIERCIQRLKINKSSPRDLHTIGSTLQSIFLLKESLELKIENMKNNDQTNAIKKLLSKISQKHLTPLLNHLSAALIDSPPPFSANDGGFIKEGYSKQLDKYKLISRNSDALINEFRETYRNKLKIPKLKVTKNSIIGHYIEVSSSDREKVPSNFIHVQTLLSVMRFKSSDLILLEEEINRAASKVLEYEISLYNVLVDLVCKYSNDIKQVSSVIANLDVSTSLAKISKQRRYIKPILVDSGTRDNLILDIKDGRHPTVENSTNEFVGNDLQLNRSNDDANLWLITGPNMGGKSTFLRQNALIILMAQMGSFVPASYAKIGIVDAIFSRVGSSDDLSNDKSTFMVEMVETASILKKATNRSFVIMDEVGRGTSTLDGISIAQSVVEYLNQVNKCRTLFATHYHELTRNLDETPHIKCYCLAIQEDEDEILFTHKIIPGMSNKSYGIFCAKMAEKNSKIKLEDEELFFKVWRNVYIRNKFLTDKNLSVPIPNKFIPYCVESLFINQNLYISKGDLPDSIDLLYFGQRFKEVLTSVVLPKNLVKLKLGHNTKISSNFILPKTIKHLTLERKYQLKLLDQVTESIEFLCIEECDENTIIPKTIKNLAFIKDFHHNLPFIPPNIEFLYIGNKFKRDINFSILSNLKFLKIGRSKKFSDLKSLSKHLTQIIHLKIYINNEAMVNSVYHYRFSDTLKILNINDEEVNLNK
ncbi:hypothetical protein RB653_002563 [Dictyostelium firmibasis]|uniref:DNA mismatch repair proteins mutS family domain-containing protein n=1 Tax=Dictyostelium firmibasis TaxID=79012 RepID=A0AAN7U356_9MYCE